MRLCVLLVSVLSLAHWALADVNGGTGCAGCTGLVGIRQQLDELHNTTESWSFVDHVCEYLPAGTFRTGCEELMDILRPPLKAILAAETSPDLTCQALGYCWEDPGYPMCNLYPLPAGSSKMKIWMLKNLPAVREFRKIYGAKIGLCDLPGADRLCDAIGRVAEHYPFVDKDLDHFSTFPTLRGYDWRGQDCNDRSDTVYPGRLPENGDEFDDANCNGIYGLNQLTGQTYEQELCSGTQQRGVAILGDSAAAGFHVPKEWVTPTLIAPEMFEYLPYIASNELDWPMTSSVTGFTNITWPVIQGPTDSVYLRMRERNRCMHRDYQSIAVNGARSGNMQRTQTTLARNQTHDQPLLLFYSLIGNDVCNGHENTIDRMTTPEEMRANALLTLDFLESTIPANSHVIMTGLVDGRVLYYYMHDRIHPLGELHQDVTYEALYDYMNCLLISPCMGWLTSNATLRDITSERAANLSKVLEDIVNEKNGSYANFDLYYSPIPAWEAMQEYEDIHGPGTAFELIEVVDGFHPSQIGKALFAQKYWEMAGEWYPQLLGDINPNNELIDSIFGDQGGH